MIELWIPITIFAAFCQNLRSAVQKHLKGELSNAGATFSRFGYGLPVVFAYVLALRYGAGMAWPEPNPEFVIYGLVGGATQIGATFLLVWLFSFRDFAVGTTYSKTETVQAVLFGLIILGDGVGLAGAVAIFVSLIGVMLLSTAKSELDWRRLWLDWTERTALIGIFSGTLFGISAVAFRAASLSLGDPTSGEGPGFLMQAGFTLAFVILAQTIGMALWMAWREPGQLAAVLRSWRWASLAGFAGALSSIGWFTAMTLQNVAYVRALGQIELVFTFAAGILIFRERSTRLEVIAILLVVAGILILVGG